jgi:thioester reductase-like protein
MASNPQILKSAAATTLRDLLARDATLPTDIVPAASPISVSPCALLTGATGFLGRYVLAELLRDTDWKIVCVVRAPDLDKAHARIRAALEETGGLRPDDLTRLQVVCGDVGEPQLGLEPHTFATLARQVDRVIHCAADVNWIKSYNSLRRSNVLGTLNTLRFACEYQAKQFHFVSTLAVCYAPDGPEQVTEDTDMGPHVEAMPLGYAQTKWISECLLQQAADRGLPVTILRPGLICGNSVSGVSNEDDLVSRLIKGCLSIGDAADVDWHVDISPVDYVARVVASVAQDRVHPRIVHIHNAEPRHWRELVLFLNLYGYSLPLIDFDLWIEKIAAARRHHHPSLYPLRPFFLARPSALIGRRLPELYLESTRRRIESQRSHDLLTARGCGPATISGALLNRYFRQYIRSGFLPAPGRRDAAATSPIEATAVEQLLQRHYTDPSLRVLDQSVTATGKNSIVNELCAATGAPGIGLWRHVLRYRRGDNLASEHLNLVIKVKADEQVTQRIAVTLGTLRGGAVATEAHQLPRALGIRDAQRREPAIYTLQDRHLTEHRPQAYGTIADDASKTWLVALEYVGDMEQADSIGAGADWTSRHLESAIRGLAGIHTYGYRRNVPADRLWLAPATTASEMNALTPLWSALAQSAETQFTQWSASWDPARHRRFIDTAPSWWQRLAELPQTLVHNDFNPRNLAFRRTPQGLRVCAFDWELAGLGVPQHDLAELLCFVLPTAGPSAAQWVELHRSELQRISGQTIDAGEWLEGFRLSLRYLLINRLSMYALIGRFSPQPFLPRVLNNWHRLSAEFDD